MIMHHNDFNNLPTRLPKLHLLGNPDQTFTYTKWHDQMFQLFKGGELEKEFLEDEDTENKIKYLENPKSYFINEIIASAQPKYNGPITDIKHKLYDLAVNNHIEISNDILPGDICWSECHWYDSRWYYNLRFISLNEIGEKNIISIGDCYHATSIDKIIINNIFTVFGVNAYNTIDKEISSKFNCDMDIKALLVPSS